MATLQYIYTFYNMILQLNRHTTNTKKITHMLYTCQIMLAENADDYYDSSLFFVSFL